MNLEQEISDIIGFIVYILKAFFYGGILLGLVIFIFNLIMKLV